MTTITLVMALVALAGVVFLAFGYSALLGIVRDLQDKLEGAPGSAPARTVSRFSGLPRAFVLVTEPSCVSCKDRIRELVEYRRRALDSSLDITVLQAASGPRPEGLPHDIEFLIDAELVGTLAVNVVPVGLVFDAGGTEIGRSVLGDAASFERFITWADSATEQVDAAPMGKG